jgi:hypothetical protein
MVTGTSDSDQVLVNTDYSTIEQSRDWSELAIDDGTISLEKNSYYLRLFSRSGNEIVSQIESIGFKQEVNAAQNPTFDIPPLGELKTNKTDYLSGAAQLFIDGKIAFAGEIIKIDTSQTIGDNISIKVRNPGRKLDDQSVDITPNNSVLQDVIGKIIDRQNDIHSEFSDMISSASLNNTTQIGDLIAVSSGNNSGTITFSDVNSDLSSLDRVNVKAYSAPSVEMELLPADSNEEDFTYTMDTLDKNESGEWVTIDIPSYPETSYDLRFTLEDNSYLFDWLAIAGSEVTRELTAPTIEQVGSDEFFYSRSGAELQNNIIDAESSNIVYDSGSDAVRAKQWGVVGEFLNSQSRSNAVNGAAEVLPVGTSSNPIDLSSEDSIENGDLYIRAMVEDYPGTEDVIAVDVGVNVGTERISSTNIPVDEWGWTSVPVAFDISSSTSLDAIEITNNDTVDGDGVNLVIDVCYWVDGDRNSTDILFSNSVDENQQLEGPREYADEAYVTFTTEASTENVTEATTTTTTRNNSTVYTAWGPSQRLTKDINFPTPPNNSNEVSNSYPFTGVEHQVRVYLGASGYDETQTPQRGYQSIELDSYEVTVSTNDLEILYDQDITGSRLQAISDLADSSTYFYRWDGNRCKVFQRGAKKSNVDVRKENATDSVGIEDVYSSAEVYGQNGVYSGVVEADNPPSFVDRNKEIRDADIETELDAQRRAISFLRNNSTIEYEGSIDTMPTFAPVGEMMDGSLFDHGQDMVIETVSYGKDRTSISLGFEQRLSRKIRGLDRDTSSLTRSQTT